MATERRNIVVTRSGAGAFIALARPEKLNPLDWTSVQEIKSAVTELEADPGIRVVAITGQGRSFSAGGDLDGYISLYANPDEFRRFLVDFFDMLNAIEKSKKIYIAAINGVCVAGGLELLLACDMAVAADVARIGDGHLNFGQLPGAGGSQRLPRVVGPLWAKRLMLTGELLTAEDARRIGLVTDVVPAAELESFVKKLMDDLLAKSPVGLRGAKHLVGIAMTRDLDDGIKYELEYVHRHATTEPDATEGLLAFRDKRAPKYGS